MAKRLSVRVETARTLAWTRQAVSPRMLHVFENSINLMDAGGEVVSIVNPTVGRGPFNIVLSDPIRFALEFTIETLVTVYDQDLSVGDWQLQTGERELWDPRPDWSALRKTDLSTVVPLLEEMLHSSRVQPALEINGKIDWENLGEFAAGLAGLGPGLTPSGDDILMGLMHAVWTHRPADRALQICAEMAAVSIPRTTTLSGAWLNAAANGEAGEPWHRLFSAMRTGDVVGLRQTASVILETGHTSGADALAGFIAGHKAVN